MAKTVSEDRKTLFEMIYLLSDEDLQKAVSYISYLCFMDSHKNMEMAEAERTVTRSKFKATLKRDVVETESKSELPFYTEPDAAPSVAMTPGGMRRTSEPAPEAPLFVELEPITTPPDFVVLEPVPEQWGVKLKRIVKILHLTFADLAFLFRVSASRVSQWFANALLEGEQEKQLRYCLEIAERVEKLGAPRFDLAVRHPLPDGEFFLEKLKGRRVTEDNLRTLYEIANEAEKSRRRAKGAKEPFYTAKDAAELYSTPLRYRR
jgi:transcriptional regulator with XRE-family HTH domain